MQFLGEYTLHTYLQLRQTGSARNVLMLPFQEVPTSVQKVGGEASCELMWLIASPRLEVWKDSRTGFTGKWKMDETDWNWMNMVRLQLKVARCRVSSEISWRPLPTAMQLMSATEIWSGLAERRLATAWCNTTSWSCPANYFCTGTFPLSHAGLDSQLYQHHAAVRCVITIHHNDLALFNSFSPECPFILWVSNIPLPYYHLVSPIFTLQV